jgi:phosphopantothenoylcysteine decarboxylase/phosphopantothenate--cysteine ligase
LIKRILLGVSGSIAAYKAAELLRLLNARGLEVRVAMTRGAQQFVSPLTFQALSGKPVASDLLDAGQESAMGHIELARWADLILIAPASANCIARLRTGMADDILSAICLASRAPLVLAPAMNSGMWQHPATRNNCQTLSARGVDILQPDEGELACGEVGPGRMPPIEQIAQALMSRNAEGPLRGKRVLLTAGPTQEAIDPVRYISNRSSGKMGFALAEAFRDAGAQVTLISGPVCLSTPRQIRREDVESARQMYDVVFRQIEAESPHIFVACAAVADYRPATREARKLKKSAAAMHLALEPNADILADVAALPIGKRPFCVGFAAETHDLLKYAQQKRLNKGLDLLAANRVGGPQGGFATDDNALLVLWQEGHAELPLMPKTALARQLVELIAERLTHEARRTEDS